MEACNKKNNINLTDEVCKTVKLEFYHSKHGKSITYDLITLNNFDVEAKYDAILVIPTHLDHHCETLLSVSQKATDSFIELIKEGIYQSNRILILHLDGQKKANQIPHEFLKGSMKHLESLNSGVQINFASCITRESGIFHLIPGITDMYGKGSQFETAFNLSMHLLNLHDEVEQSLSEKKHVFCLDGDLKETTNWVKWMGMAGTQYDYVTPYYYRHKYDATITRQIVRPLLGAICGVDIAQPIGGDFCFNGKVLKALIESDRWCAETRRYGIDIFMTLTAIEINSKVGQVELTPKLHDDKTPLEVYDMSIDVTSSMLKEIVKVLQCNILKKKNELVRCEIFKTLNQQTNCDNWTFPEEEVIISIANKIMDSKPDEYLELISKIGIFEVSTVEKLKGIFNCIKNELENSQIVDQPTEQRKISLRAFYESLRRYDLLSHNLWFEVLSQVFVYVYNNFNEFSIPEFIDCYMGEIIRLRNMSFMLKVLDLPTYSETDENAEKEIELQIDYFFTHHEKLFDKLK